MTYLQLTYIHLASVAPAFMIGTYIMLNRKGTPTHRLLGKVYMLLMLFTAIVSLFMAAKVGPTLWNHFGFIHLLSLLTLIAVPHAYFAVRRGNITSHKRAMVSLYIGGMLVAGGFTLFPSRMLNGWLFG